MNKNLKNKSIVYGINLLAIFLLLLWVNIANLFMVSYTAVFSSGFYAVVSWTMLLVAILLIVVPKVIYKTFPGKAALNYLREKDNVHLKPLKFYGWLYAAGICLYVVLLPVSDMVFSSMVEKQVEKLKEKNISLEWRDYYSSIDYKDPENSGLLLKKAERLFSDDMKSLSQDTWMLLINNKIDLNIIEANIKKLSREGNKAIKTLDEAIEKDKFLYKDLKDIRDNSLLQDMGYWNVSTVRAYSRQKLVEMYISLKKERKKDAREKLIQVMKMQGLLKDDQTIISMLIRTSIVENAYGVLDIYIGEEGLDENVKELYEILFKETDLLEGMYYKAIKAETAIMYTQLGVIAEKTIPLKERIDVFRIVGTNQKEESFGEVLFYRLMYLGYRPFVYWDRYIHLRLAELQIMWAKENEFEKRKAIYKKIEGFEEKYLRDSYPYSPAIMTMIVSSQFYSYYERELKLGMLRDMAKVYIKVHEHEKATGVKLTSLDDVVNRYKLMKPVNSINGSEVVYEISQKGKLSIYSTYEDMYYENDNKFGIGISK